MTLRSSSTKEYRIPKKKRRERPGILSTLLPGHVHSVPGHAHSEHVRAVSPAETPDSSCGSESGLMLHTDTSALSRNPTSAVFFGSKSEICKEGWIPSARNMSKTGRARLHLGVKKRAIVV